MTTKQLITKRKPLAQLLFCQGCCCGRTDRGKPELPVELLKSAWKEHKLNACIQLTISGCLGPCDLTNVTLLLTPAGQTWLGGLTGEPIYQKFIDWVMACKNAGSLLPLPEQLAPHIFQRWASDLGVTREASV